MEYYETPDLKIDDIEINVSSITSDYYIYLKGSVEPSDIEEAFYEPAITHTNNIIGGSGIVAGKNPTIKKLLFIN